MMSVKFTREMIACANGKLKSAAKHRVQHFKVRSDVESKWKCAFEKFMKNNKKK